MNKFNIIFVLILILTYGCGYTPIYSTKELNFVINKINLEGERNINKIINQRLKNYSKNNQAKNIYDIGITSSLEKKITTKDKKGNPTQFSLKLIVAVSVNDSFNQIEQQIFRESSSYKNNENKFDLKNYEDNLVQNMSEKIISDIILFIQNLD
tara:strand:+ start:2823 stop:3284 length:462 start_codon:yes stop_codon:yes gene_type:complete